MQSKSSSGGQSIELLTVQNSPNTSSCGYTDRIISMMIGVAFSRGEVSIRTTSSIGRAVPRWAVMSSSAGSDIGVVLLRGGRWFGGVAEKGCEWRDFVGRALDADDGRPVGVH